MARTVTPRKPKAQPDTLLEVMLREYMQALAIQNYSEHTISNRTFHLVAFIRWCQERGLTEPLEVTRPVLERYQRYLFHYRKKNGDPMSFRTQHSRLVPLRMWFRWMTRRNHLLHNPASELELPKLGQPLPRNIFSAQEVERILLLCDIDDPIGLRDRAIIEVLYSTGIRRMEVIALKLYDLSLERGVLLVRQGKGKKDRYVPIGERAIAWLQKYIEESRPQLASEPDDMTVFLTANGEPFSRDHMTSNVKARIDAAKLGKTGACHLFRHTMATLMHENGADIRHIQEILGHVKLETTQIYTHVSIRTLQKVHASTHPAAMLTRPAASASVSQRPGGDDLFAALHAEADEEREDGG
jgi:integrase/recombinase XerD